MPTVLSIALLTIKEILLGLFFKIAWRSVAERFITRGVIWGLKKLRDFSTNDVFDETLTDIIASLRGKRLYVMDYELDHE